MSRDRTRIRREEDALRLLHVEMSRNDYYLRKGRKQAKAKRRNTGDRGRTVIRHVPATEPVEVRDARHVVAGIAAGLDATAGDLRQVLDLLGLLIDAQLATTFTALGQRRADTMACQECGRPSIRTRQDGTLISHTPRPGMRLGNDTRCPGTGQAGGRPTSPADAAPVPVQEPEPAAAAAAARRTSKVVALRGRPACQDEDPELFFPPTYSSTSAAQIKQARRVCRDCPFARECLRWALSNEVNDGIWAGTTPNQRQALREAAPERRTA